ncbi:MAG: hypothetical protein KAR20_22675 [Candidatus Heimdallarchaeota archaeon]|nr:hypothetical protein [Candidatus Heimdallarchaeota archaeon]
MKRLQKIRLLDKSYFIFVLATCIFAGIIIAFNELYINSEQLFLQYAIIFIVGVVGVFIWQRNKS